MAKSISEQAGKMCSWSLERKLLERKVLGVAPKVAQWLMKSGPSGPN